MLRSRHTKGFTLVELLVTVAIFAVVSVAIGLLFKKVLEVARVARIKTVAATVANEFIEYTRLLSYEDVGLVGGVPSGSLPQNQIVQREEYSFLLETYVRNIDNAFDGTLGGTQSDSAPADYKLVETRVSCHVGCTLPTPMLFTTRVSPKGLETQGTNGSILLRVLDASGVAVPGARVDVLNQVFNPDIDFYDTTNDEGSLAIVDAPPATQSYELVVTKSGYTSARTYLPSDASGLGYTVATQPHVTVQQQQLTQITMFIDQYSSVELQTVDTACLAVGQVDYTLRGTKLIGSNPSVYEYNQSGTTSGIGVDTKSDVPWDSYEVLVTDSSHELIGTNRYNAVNVLPGATETIQAIVKPRTPRTLMVAVLDAGTHLPIDGAQVSLTRTGYSGITTTGLGSTSQLDWSAGSGQAMYTNQSMYWSKTAGANINNQGDIRLTPTSGNRYQLSGSLDSSTFTFPAGINFYTIAWLPQGQPSQTGTNSVKFQVASNTDNVTWDYVGPDGTSATYYTLTNNTLHSSHDGDTYMRYRAYLQTTNNRYTPTVSSVSFVYDTDCQGPGYTHFSGLSSSGTYTLSVSHPSYSTATSSVSMGADWQSAVVYMQP